MPDKRGGGIAGPGGGIGRVSEARRSAPPEGVSESAPPLGRREAGTAERRRRIIHAARRVFVYLVVMGVLLIVGVAVPGIGTVIAAVLGFIATARFASYDAFDAIWSRRRYRYRQKTGYLRDNRWRTLGLGAVCAVPLVVPGLNVIALAIGATAATLRVVEQERLRAAVGTATKS